jgi:hypothetical protein
MYVIDGFIIILFNKYILCPKQGAFQGQGSRLSGGWDELCGCGMIGGLRLLLMLMATS